jgi:hypothetical protein
VSCSAVSSPAFASTTPVRPPSVNRKINPTANSLAGLSIRSEPPHIVAIQLKILIPVGTAIIIVAAVK